MKRKKTLDTNSSRKLFFTIGLSTSTKNNRDYSLGLVSTAHRREIIEKLQSAGEKRKIISRATFQTFLQSNTPLCGK